MLSKMLKYGNYNFPSYIYYAFRYHRMIQALVYN